MPSIAEQNLAISAAIASDEAEARRRDTLRGATGPEEEAKQKHIHDFVQGHWSAQYPESEYNNADEATPVDHSGVPARTAILAEVERAMRLSTKPILAVVLVQALLTSYDRDFDADLENVPPALISVDRVLAHLAVLRFDIEDSVALSIARRISKVLLAKAADTPHARRLSRTEARAAAASFGTGTDFAAAFKAPTLRQPPVHEERVSRSYVKPVPAEVPASSTGAIHEPGGEPGTPAGEPARGEAPASPAETAKNKPAPAEVRVPPSPPTTVAEPAEPSEWVYPPRTMVLDYTEGLESLSMVHRPTAIGGGSVPSEPRERTKREVLDHAIVEREMMFHDKGKPLALKVGTFVEVLKPSRRDQSDMQHSEQDRGIRLAVIRWGRGTVSLVQMRNLARATPDEWAEQKAIEEHVSKETSRDE